MDWKIARESVFRTLPEKTLVEAGVFHGKSIPVDLQSQAMSKYCAE